MDIINKHVNPKCNKAHAPYNFISLPHKVVKAELPLPCHDRYYEDRHTGYIDCHIKTESPLYVRCDMTPELFKEYKDKSYDELTDDQKKELSRFYFTKDENSPIIPGSSIRGMIRTLVEIASYGKISYVDDKKLAYRAVADKTNIKDHYSRNMKKQKAGYINKWNDDCRIRLAEKLGGRDYIKIKEKFIPKKLAKQFPEKCNTLTKVDTKNYGIYDIYVDESSINEYGKVTKVSEIPCNNYKKATLIISGPMGNKRYHYIIGLPNKEAELVPIPFEMIKDYHSQMTDWQKDNIGEDGVLKDGYPVFYVREGRSLKFFGHTRMFRLVYDKTIGDHIPEDLKDDKIIDMTDAIFGYASKENEQGLAGRVSFGDAHLESRQDDVWLTDGPIHPKILAEPKTTAFQLYLTQQYPDMKDKNDNLNHYDPSIDPNNGNEYLAAIRGHKLYWHKRDVGINEIKAKDDDVKKNSKQYTLINPVKRDVCFKSRIYYENLSNVELGALLWVLNLPKNCRHSLGMGKPYGMGAVKIEADAYQEDRKKRYEKLFEDKSWSQPTEKLQPDKYVESFGKYIFENVSSADRGKSKDYSELERIKMLIKMLEWSDHKDEKAYKDKTSYMDLNEFEDRLVLPDPLYINRGNIVNGKSYENLNARSAKVKKRNS